MIWTRALAAWGLIIACETVLGALRGALVAPAVGDWRARQLGVPIGLAVIVGVGMLTARWIGTRTTGQRLAVGALWVALTVAFELALGVGAMRLSWARVLEDYDLSRGGLMGLGLLGMFLTPLLAARWRGLDRRA
ncbi:MAG: hypothetical protein KIT68_01230 [Phycisphaeraceae bacterium]|nr:hypothetical protein [Phycisphaeraceae bacterium]